MVWQLVSEGLVWKGGGGGEVGISGERFIAGYERKGYGREIEVKSLVFQDFW